MVNNNFRIYGFCTLSEGKRHVIECDDANGTAINLDIFTKTDVNLTARSLWIEGRITNQSGKIVLIADMYTDLEEYLRGKIGQSSAPSGQQ